MKFRILRRQESKIRFLRNKKKGIDLWLRYGGYNHCSYCCLYHTCDKDKIIDDLHRKCILLSEELSISHPVFEKWK